jgi:hypothetical protein
VPQELPLGVGLVSHGRPYRVGSGEARAASSKEQGPCLPRNRAAKER